jgi:hypothetical protein
MARIVFAGYAVRSPLGGYLWQTVHYLAGLRALGHDAIFYEDTGLAGWELEAAYNPTTDESSPAYDYGVATVGAFLDRLGFGDRWVFVDLVHGRAHGPLAAKTDDVLGGADVLINLGPVNGRPIEQWNGRPAIFIDSDPVYHQILVDHGDAGLRAFLEAHTHLFTLGENIGTSRSRVPTAGLTWYPTRPPVALDLWSHPVKAGSAYTTVARWNAQGRDMIYKGEWLGWTKRTQWLRFLDVPARTGVAFELAADVDSEAGDRELLTSHGWRCTDPLAVSTDPWRYRDYLSGSRGEFTVAKEMNVRLRSGWFSDRAACYLAAGRPVVEQDTAFGDILPCGPGLHAFNTPEQAAAAIRIIEADYQKASAHATHVAREYFAAERVIGSMLARIGL